jgi:mRNA-degrading endonuclease RelE of RelBE toxin-antitoxin system
MAYNISFRRTVESAFESLTSEERSRLMKKLKEIAGSEFRSPEDWFESWEGHPAGSRYKVGSYRVFAEVNPDDDEIVVHEARRRENLYA